MSPLWWWAPRPRRPDAGLGAAAPGLGGRIVDKSAARTDKSKAVVIWPRTLELLDIQGCAQTFVDAGVPAPGVRPALQVLVSEAHAAAAQGYAAGHHYLVRPDGSLALSTRGDDPSAIFGWLQRLSSA